MNTLIKNLSKPRATVIPLVAAAVITLSACVADDDPNRRAKLGVGIGAVGGAVIAKVTGSDNVLLGATLGALAGGAVGHYQDRQQAALKVALEKELRNKQVDVQRLDNDVLLVRLNSQASFDSGSAEVKPAFHSTLDKIATETSTFDKTILHVVGYTDSDGTDEFNQRLSVKRADSVADYLNGDGVVLERLRTEGRGETEPRVPNTSAANKAANRRVEIYIKPIVEGQEQEALERPFIGGGVG